MMRWRFALGVCMVSAALLVGSAGGAIAAADPDPDSVGTTAEGQGVDGSTQGVSSASGPVESTAEPGTSASLSNSSASLSNSSQQESASPGGPMTIGATQEPAATGTNESVTAVAEQQNEGSGSSTAVTTELASNPDVVVSHSQVVAPPPAVVASDPIVVAPARKRLAAVRTVVAPVRSAVRGAANAVGALPAVVAKLPSSPTPVRDVITAVQDMLTSVAAVGSSVTQAQADLASLLGFPEMAARAPGGIGGSLYGGGPSAAVDTKVLASGAAQWPQILVTSGNSGVASVGNVADRPTLGGVATTGLSQELSVSGAAPVAPESVAPTGVLSILEHTISAVLVPASLTVLAALALPGIGGLLIIGATGMMVGYRQAKAASMLRAVGIARFVRAGPLGVVRSGSLVALHPRALRADRRQPSRAASLLERVALAGQHDHIQLQIYLRLADAAVHWEWLTGQPAESTPAGPRGAIAVPNICADNY